MAKNSPELLRFLYDMMTDSEVRRRFSRNPRRVLKKKYDLAPKQREAIYTMDPDKVSAALLKVLDDFEIPTGEFPPDSAECLPDAFSTNSEYPSPTPAIFRLVPDEVSRSTLPADPNDPTVRFLTLIVRGQSFAPGATTVHLEPKAGSGNPSTASPHTFGTYRCSGVRAVVTLVDGTHGNGKYVVRLKINEGTANEVIVPVPDDFGNAEEFILTIKA